MAYKDPDKQREANAERQRRYKAKQKALPEQGVTGKALPKQTFEEFSKTHVIATVKALPIEPERTAQGNIRVSKPGDADYVPQCETTRAFVEGRDKRPETVKRGKGIKVFADLPVTVQQTINILSDDKTEHKRRTAIAINYQHLFPDKFHSVGAAG